MKRNLKKEIGDYIIEQYKADEDIFVDYTPLFVYLDSLDKVELVMWIEKHYNIDIPANDDSWMQWEYLNDVVKYVEKKLEERA